MKESTTQSSAWSILFGVLLMLVGCADHQPLASRATVARDASQLFIPATGTYSQVAAGETATCALRSDGAVECWGISGSVPAAGLKTAASGTFTSVTMFAHHACALRSDGAAECWGDNGHGQAPGVIFPPAGTSFIAVDAGFSYSCAVRTDGAVQCWGQNLVGEAPASQMPLTGFYTAVRAGASNTCALISSGPIECFGVLGLRQIVPSTTFTKPMVGPSRLCGLITQGTVECLFSTLAISGSFDDYDAYTNHECGINTSGVAQCLMYSGVDPYGQAPATRAAATGRFTQISVNREYSCAVRTDGAIECWGNPLHRAGTVVVPTATFSAPSSVIAGQPFSLAFSNAQVPGYPNATTFTYAFDCGEGSGFGAASTASSKSCATTTTGTRTVHGRVIDQDGTPNTYSGSVLVKTIQQGATDLLSDVTLAGLSPDIRKALTAKLNAALSAIAKGKTAGACSALKDFVNQVNAQRGKAIDATTADSWILTAQQLQAALGC